MSDMSERHVSGIDSEAHRTRPIPPAAVRRLYAHVAWRPHRSDADIDRLLTAGPAVGAWDGDTLIGFARAVTDGPCRAYIEDVLVRDTYRHRGVGTVLLARLLEDEDVALVDTVSLFCAPDLVSFYAAQGFRPTKQLMMHRRNSL